MSENFTTPLNPMIITETPESSAIIRIGFSPFTGELSILFRKEKNYPEYVWGAVPLEVGLEFLEAGSKGKYYHRRIKNNPKYHVTPALGSRRLAILGKNVKRLGAAAARALITRGK